MAVAAVAASQDLFTERAECFELAKRIADADGEPDASQVKRVCGIVRVRLGGTAT